MTTKAKPYPRPVLKPNEMRKLAKFANQLLTKPISEQVGVLAGLLGENVILTKEVNEHRFYRGFELLQTHEPEFKE